MTAPLPPPPGRPVAAPPARPDGANGSPAMPPAVAPVASLELADLISLPREGVDPQLLLAIGPPGTGKTSLAAGGPAPVFVMADRGGARSLSKRLFPHRIYPNSWAPVKGESPTVRVIGEDGQETEERRVYVVDVLQTLLIKQHDRRTVVFDTLNRLRDLLHAYICASNGKAESIDMVGRGYGEGTNKAAVEWNKMLSICWDLRDRRRMNVVLTCHQEAKKVPQAHGEDVEMWVPELDKRAIAIWNGGVDTILYLQPTSRVVSAENIGSAKNPRMRNKVNFEGVTAYTRPAQGMWAKNRDMLPDEIDGITWSILEEEGEKGAAIRDELQEVLAGVPRDVRIACERIMIEANWSQSAALDIINKARKAG